MKARWGLDLLMLSCRPLKEEKEVAPSPQKKVTAGFGDVDGSTTFAAVIIRRNDDP